MPSSTKKTDGGRIPGGVVIPNCIEVVWFWVLVNGRTGHTVTHARNRGTFVPSVATANGVMSSLSTNFTTNLALRISTLAALQAVSVRDMGALTNPAFRSDAPSAPGTSAVNALAPQTAAVLTGETALRGKGTRTRYYIPGFTVDGVTGAGAIAGPTSTSLTAFGNALIGNYTANGLDLGLARPARQAYTGITGTNHPARSPATVEPVTAVVLKDVVYDTVRSRVKP